LKNIKSRLPGQAVASIFGPIAKSFYEYVDFGSNCGYSLIDFRNGKNRPLTAHSDFKEIIFFEN
jgi:hypothetical protein